MNAELSLISPETVEPHLWEFPPGQSYAQCQIALLHLIHIRHCVVGETNLISYQTLLELICLNPEPLSIWVCCFCLLAGFLLVNSTSEVLVLILQVIPAHSSVMFSECSYPRAM